MNRYPPNSSIRSDFEIAGTRIVLTPIRASDSPRNYRWECDTELATLNGRAPITMSYLEYLTLSPQEEAPSSKLVFAIRTKKDECHIGNCALYDFDYCGSEASLGISIGERAFHRRGYGTDAIKTMAGYAFFQQGIARLQLKTLAWNAAALTCFVKCGFQTCGTSLENGHRYILMQLGADRFLTLHQPSDDVERES